MIVGGYYGETNLRAGGGCMCEGNSVNLSDQLSILGDVLMSIYGINYHQRAALLFQYGKVLGKW